jgi:hypothetical protein
MVARVKSTRFGCMLAASLFVLVLAGCADVSESVSTSNKEWSILMSREVSGRP